MMPSPSVPEPAVAVGEDPRQYARLMSAVYDATMAGDHAPARPRQVIGVVDVSGPAATVHPTTVALVDGSAPPALAVDQDGWVAAVDAMPLHNRILLPSDLAPGRVQFSTLGPCDVEPLPGGWLVRLALVGGSRSDLPR